MKVVFLGTKQARIVCDLYRRLRGADDDISYLDSSAEIGATEEKQLTAADIIAWQANGAPPPYDLDEIGALGERIRFPDLTLDFLWPFGGQPHIRNTWDPLFPEGPFPADIGDAWLNRRLAGRQQAEAVEAEYLALDVPKTVDLGDFRRLWRARQSEIDRICETDYAARFDEEFRRRPLFLNPSRPADDLLRDVAEKLFARLRPGLALPDDCRFEYAPELPLHPSVAQHFRLDWATDRLYRGWSEEQLTFAEYVRRYLAYADGPELEIGMRLEALGRHGEALAPLQRAAGRLSGRLSLSLQNALARSLAKAAHSPGARAARAGAAKELEAAATLAAEGRLGEAEAKAQSLIESDPNHCEAWLLLADVREKQGAGAGQAAALRRALALRPSDAGLMSRLTLALANAGDWHGAVDSAEREVAHNPDNPHSRAFLSALLDRIGETARARAQLERAIEIVATRPEYANMRDELMQRRAEAPAAE